MNLTKPCLLHLLINILNLVTHKISFSAELFFDVLRFSLAHIYVCNPQFCTSSDFCEHHSKTSLMAPLFLNMIRMISCVNVTSGVIALLNFRDCRWGRLFQGDVLFRSWKNKNICFACGISLLLGNLVTILQ